MTFISQIPPLKEGNYRVWREKYELALTLSENDLALTSPCFTEPVDPVREENETDADFTARQRNHAEVRMKYDLEHKKWDISNRKCLMVAKSIISYAIRGSIPDYDAATEYLNKVESHFTCSSKAYASTLIKKLFNEKYTSGGIREHILKMSNMASKLKSMDLGLKDEFLIHLVFASLTKEYETFVVNYNMQLDKWDIEKLIAMCVQEEERLKSSQGDSTNLVKDNKKKNFNKNTKPHGKPLRLSTIRRTTMPKLKKISANSARSMDITRGTV
ncbi:uncharacterized protein [Miscanthus floridulus]|uniref:uncharacterized protein n=1 Tax=Miscanthus floridulus TaxID=154761 RepID=UPI003458199E